MNETLRGVVSLLKASVVLETCIKVRRIILEMFFLNPMPHMSLTDFVVFPPGDGRSVTDF